MWSHAVRVGLGLFPSVILLIRYGLFEVGDPLVRAWPYRIHV